MRMKIPAGAFAIVKEVLRHVLRRPVVGVAVVGRDSNGRVLLVRRADTGTWALPGGTLEWGERLRTCVVRELREEANAEQVSEPTVVGVYSDPDRDPRFHGVTIVVSCRVVAPEPRSENPLEIREVRFFEDAEIPREMAFGMQDMLEHERARGAPHFE